MRILHKINSYMVTKIINLKSKEILIYYCLLFFIGRFINAFFRFRLITIHQINLSIIPYITLLMLRLFYKEIKAIEREFNGKNVTIFLEFKRLRKRIYSGWNILIPIISCCVFVFVIFFLDYLPLNPIGIYGAYVATSSFFFALMAYYAFVNSIICIYRLQKKASESLPFTYPEDIKEPPHWIKTLQNLYKKAEAAIFTVGTLFTLEYILLVPVDSVQFQPHFTINSNHPIIFLYNWVIIAGFVIIACPILLYLMRKYINNLFEKVFAHAKQYIDNVFEAQDLTIENLFVYQQVVKTLKTPGMYCLSEKMLYPTLATVLSLMLNVFKFLESYLYPFLWNSI